MLSKDKYCRRIADLSTLDVLPSRNHLKELEVERFFYVFGPDGQSRFVLAAQLNLHLITDDGQIRTQRVANNGRFL